MSKKILKTLIVGVFSVLISYNAGAWGMQGHRIVGEIAYFHLNAKAKKEIQQILGNEPMAMASNWPDFIKSDTAYKYLNAWHYVDVEQHLSFLPMRDSLKTDTASNAYNKINFLVEKLKNRSLSLKEKQMYLRLLIHIVGDVHQPFHVGRKGDRGGNDIKVSWFGEPSNMHKIWDEELIEYQELSYTEYVNVINFVTPQQKKDWQSSPIEQWFFESYEISEKIHDDVKPGDKLSYNYNFKYVQTLNQQLLKGGVRLAGLLNEIFGK